MSAPIPLVMGFGSHPPSNAAHRLAWWLGERGDRWERFWRGLGVRSSLIEEALRGSWEPGPVERDAIAGLTLGAVTPEDWDRGCCLCWSDKPAGWAGPPGARRGCASFGVEA